ncbi:MAG: STAS domain-containing protein [Rubricoccaceae bacterium]|nr:STAS domain-containing protein [Rubricoccaceae bacterium]
MSKPIQERYNAVVMRPKGEFFGSVEGPGFRKEIEGLISEGKCNLVLDLSSTTLMDSSGIGLLIESATKLRENGGDLRIAELESKMRNLFLMTRLLGDVFELYDSVEDAVASYSASDEG